MILLTLDCREVTKWGKKGKKQSNTQMLEGQYLAITNLKNIFYFTMIEEFPEQAFLKSFLTPLWKETLLSRK